MRILTADRGYDDGHNHFLLESRGIHSAIRLNGYRTQKKHANKEVWLRLKATPEYERGLQERYKIERKSGEGKRGHGRGRCRYVGLLRYGLQAFLTAIVLNLKRIVKLLVGVPFKSSVQVGAWSGGDRRAGRSSGRKTEHSALAAEKGRGPQNLGVHT